MNEKLVRRFHWFWIWQDTEQEAWLEEMSRQGLHLEAIGALGSHRFIEGPSRGYSYRLDYNRNKPDEEYFQIIRDAGWEYLGKSNGWHYWRKEVGKGEAQELFTDRDSKIQKYKRLFAAFVTSTPAAAALYIIGVAAFKRFPGRHPDWFVVLFISLFVLWILFAAFQAVMIYRRMKAIEQGAPR